MIQRTKPFVNARSPLSGSALPTTRELTVTTDDGVALAVRDTGSNAATHTVVFLHGLCLSQLTWSLHIDRLVRRYGPAIRIISYDHRGHGRSQHAPMNTYSIDRLAEDLALVLEAARVAGPTTLVGHSMGGMTALGYLARPASGRPIDPVGLVLAASAAGKLCCRGLGQLLGTPATAALRGAAEHVPEQAMKAMLSPLCVTLRRWRRNPPAATLAALAMDALSTVTLATAVGFLPALRDYDQYRVLGSIRARTVVISGGADPLTPPAHGRDLAGGIPGARHVHLPRAGHMLPQEAPHVLHQAIRRAMNIDSATEHDNAAGATTAAAPTMAGAAS
ncbi:alpha/beta fold hydrolase [Mycobacterium sp. NPDC003323]